MNQDCHIYTITYPCQLVESAVSVGKGGHVSSDIAFKHATFVRGNTIRGGKGCLALVTSSA